MKWADAVRKLKVRANADTPADARAAIKFGAEGIGLCRTEHMFFEEDRIRAVREMILAETTRRRAAPRLPSCCRCSAPISSSCSRSWAACR
jgi:pyruvate,orthophosphate dikinase